MGFLTRVKVLRSVRYKLSEVELICDKGTERKGGIMRLFPGFS